MFTKGPWKYSRTHMASSSTWYVITDKKGYGPIIEVGGKDKNGQIAEAKYLITDPREIEANARLISRAPSMYFALQIIADAEDDLPDDVNELKELVRTLSAIAKSQIAGATLLN